MDVSKYSVIPGFCTVVINNSLGAVLLEHRRSFQTGRSGGGSTLLYSKQLADRYTSCGVSTRPTACRTAYRTTKHDCVSGRESRTRSMTKLASLLESLHYATSPVRISYKQARLSKIMTSPTIPLRTLLQELRQLLIKQDDRPIRYLLRAEEVQLRSMHALL